MRLTDTTVAADGEIEINSIQVQQVRVKLVTRIRYRMPPHLVPEEFKDDNRVEIEEPPVVHLIDEKGNEIPVYFTRAENQVVVQKEVIDPELES